MGTTRLPGSHYSSLIMRELVRDGCAVFEFNIPVYFEFYNGFLPYMGHHWDCTDPWVLTPGANEQDQYVDHFIKTVEDGWGNGAIWLLHEWGGPDGHPDLWCQVNLYRTSNRSDAKLVVRAVKNPKSMFPV